MPDHIELHDSRLVVVRAAGAVVIQLRPAYVHHWTRTSGGWRGEGRSQAADVRIAAGSVASPPGDGPLQVVDGWLQAGDQRFENLLPAPLEAPGPVSGSLTLVNAPPLTFAGVGLEIRLAGSPVFVEALPAEWAPDAGAA
jgi:hypothetical protein